MTEQLNKSNNTLESAEFNRFGIISMLLLIVGCLGGIAVGLGAVENVVTLTMVVVPTMVTLSLLLAVSPMKYILTSAAIATVIDILFILYFVFV